MVNSALDKSDTRLLLRTVLGFSQSQLITNGNYRLTAQQYHSYIELYVKCLGGMPLAYILGYKEFYSRRFKVTHDTLIPRPETELLVEMALKLAKNEGRVLDLGTGSGCIAVTIKLENPILDVTATDKYEATLDVAAVNATNLGADINFIQSDWLLSISGMYNIIVSNPPYIQWDDRHLSGLTFEPQHALTDFANGLTYIEQIIRDSRRHLENSGYLLLEHGYNQGDQVRQLMQEYGFTHVITNRDYANLDRITYGRLGENAY